MTIKYDAAKIQDLSDVDKLRIIAAYLNHNSPKEVDWAAAAVQAGSKSKESYKKMFDAALKKLVATEDEDDEPAPAVKNTAPKKATKKRAAPAVDDGEGNINPDAAKKPKTTRKPRAKKTGVQKPEDKAGEEVGAKGSKREQE